MKTWNWNKTSDSKKKLISRSKPLFIIGSREMSEARVIDLANSILSKTEQKILWGVAQEKYIEGLTNSTQFRTLSKSSLQAKLYHSENINLDRIDILEYFQRDLIYILKDLKFSAVIFINGSWHRSLHNREEFWAIVNRKIPYKLLSPFIDENEAIAYWKKLEERRKKLKIFDPKKSYSDEEIMKIVTQIASYSFDWTWQTGCALVKKPKKNSGQILLISHNRILPYETYSMHYGSLREKNFSPPNDLNNYDTIHAEVGLILEAQKKGIDLKGTSLYIDLMPCPTCAKMIAASDIDKVVYSKDHSEGYAIKLFKSLGKKARRLI